MKSDELWTADNEMLLRRHCPEINLDNTPISSLEWKKLHAERKAARAASARLLDRAEKEKRELTDQEDIVFSMLGKLIEGANNEFERRERSRQYGPRMPAHEDTDCWHHRDGQATAVLTREQRMADTLRPPDDETLGFGRMIRAMVTGPKNDLERRVLAEGTDSTGGFTVPDITSARLIDKLRAKTVSIQAGAQTVRLESDHTTIARLATDPTVGWKLENDPVAASDPTFEGVVLQPRVLIALVKASRELIDDSLNIEQGLEAAFAGAMAVELDRVALFGSGTAPEPRGVFNTSGINSVSMGTNGAQLTGYGKILDCFYEIEQDNAGPATAMVMAPRTGRVIDGLVDSTGQPLMPPKALADVPMLRTTGVPVNQVQGSASNASPIIVGDFTQMIIGVRLALRIEVLRERFADNLQYGFLAYLRADIGLVHPESFCRLVGIIP